MRDAPRAWRRDVQAVRRRREAPAQACEEGPAAPPARGQGARVVGHEVALRERPRPPQGPRVAQGAGRAVLAVRRRDRLLAARWAPDELRGRRDRPRVQGRLAHRPGQRRARPQDLQRAAREQDAPAARRPAARQPRAGGGRLGRAAARPHRDGGGDQDRRRRRARSAARRPRLPDLAPLVRGGGCPSPPPGRLARGHCAVFSHKDPAYPAPRGRGLPRWGESESSPTPSGGRSSRCSPSSGSPRPPAESVAPSRPCSASGPPTPRARRMPRGLAQARPRQTSPRRPPRGSWSCAGCCAPRSTTRRRRRWLGSRASTARPSRR